MSPDSRTDYREALSDPRTHVMVTASDNFHRMYRGNMQFTMYAGRLPNETVLSYEYRGVARKSDLF